MQKGISGDSFGRVIKWRTGQLQVVKELISESFRETLVSFSRAVTEAPSVSLITR